MNKKNNAKSIPKEIPWKYYAVLFASVFVLYGNAINNEYVLDDDVVILQNQFVQKGLSGIPDIISHGFLYGFNQKNDQSYRPLVLINFALEHQLFGNNPAVQHLLGILFYGLACCLLFSLLSLMLPSDLNGLSIWICLLFLFHPVHAEVVANVKGRDEILHMIFYLWALNKAFLFIDSGQKRQLYWSMLFLFLACLCKEMAVTALLVFPLSLFVFRKVENKKLFQTSLFLALPVLIYLLLRNQILDTVTFDEEMSIINNTLAAAESMSSQWATALVIFGYYLKLLVWPHPLSWDYSFPFFQVHQISEPAVLLFLLLLLASVLFSIHAVIKRKDFMAYGWLFFLLTFSIVSNFFILIGSTLGERFLFLPSVGVCLLLSIGLKRLLEQFKLQVKTRDKVCVALMIIVLVPAGFKTHLRSGEWKSNESLFEAGIKANPTSSRAVSAYASIFREIGESDPNPALRQKNLLEAVSWYKKSLELYPEVAEVWYNLGVCYMGLNELELAKASFQRAIDFQNTYIQAHNNLGVIYFRAKDFDNAEIYFQQCLALNDTFQSAYANLGAVYHNRGQLQKAKEYYARALSLNPQDQNTRNNYQLLVNQ